VLPSSGDSSDAVTAFTSYNDGVESRLVKRYASAAERTVRNPTPNEGELSYLTDSGRYYSYDGSSWIDFIAAIAPLSASDSDSTTISSIADTSYVSGSPIVGVTFTAADTGNVLLSIYGRLGSDGTRRLYFGFYIREDDISGSIFESPTGDNNAIAEQDNSPGFIGSGRSKLITGLTPGQVYFAYTVYRVSSGTPGTITYREISVATAP